MLNEHILFSLHPTEWEKTLISFRSTVKTISLNQYYDWCAMLIFAGSSKNRCRSSCRLDYTFFGVVECDWWTKCSAGCEVSARARSRRIYSVKIKNVHFVKRVRYRMCFSVYLKIISFRLKCCKYYFCNFHCFSSLDVVFLFEFFCRIGIVTHIHSDSNQSERQKEMWMCCVRLFSQVMIIFVHVCVCLHFQSQYWRST